MNNMHRRIVCLVNFVNIVVDSVLTLRLTFRCFRFSLLHAWTGNFQTAVKFFIVCSAASFMNFSDTDSSNSVV